MDKIKHIPLDQIQTTALPRDRTLIETNALDELTASIRTNGLRLPIEVYPTENTFALIAGYRRHLAFQTLAQSDSAFAKIPAFIRSPQSMPSAMAAMIEENEMRQSLSPWERAHIIVRATDMGTFKTIDEATQTLFPHASRQKRAKLRTITDVIMELDGLLTDPELLTERQLMRLSNAIRHDWTDIIQTALTEQRGLNSRQQWARILPTLTELEGLIANNHTTTSNSPRRNITPRAGITVRRESTPYGYTLHISGRKATGMLMSSVMDEIERWLGEG
jgi:ParB family chromosome partitioning protein